MRTNKMNRRQLEKYAEKLGLKLDAASEMEKAESAITGDSPIRWVVRTPGYAAGDGFRTLAEVEEFLDIEMGGQEL